MVQPADLLPVTAAELSALAESIRASLRSLLREVRVEPRRGGVVLSGSAYSYHGKQLAQHEVLRRGLPLIANEIVVQSTENSGQWTEGKKPSSRG